MPGKQLFRNIFSPLKKKSQNRITRFTPTDGTVSHTDLPVDRNHTSPVWVASGLTKNATLSPTRSPTPLGAVQAFEFNQPTPPTWIPRSGRTRRAASGSWGGGAVSPASRAVSRRWRRSPSLKRSLAPGDPYHRNILRPLLRVHGTNTHGNWAARELPPWAHARFHSLHTLCWNTSNETYTHHHPNLVFLAISSIFLLPHMPH